MTECMLRAYRSVPVNSFVFERTFSCRTQWPSLPPPTLCMVSVPRNKSPSFMLKSECSLLDDANTSPLSVTAIPARPGIFEIVLVFNLPRN